MPDKFSIKYTGRNGGPPQKLTDIANRANELVDAAAEQLVRDGIDFMEKAIVSHVPVSHDPGVPGFEYVPGGDGIHLKDTFRSTDPDSKGSVWSADTGTDKDYGPYVDEGTGLYGPKHAKYLIVPHDPAGHLAWPGADGKMHFATHVWHPGSPGAHFMMKGLYDTESGFMVWRRHGDDILNRGMDG